MAKTLDLFGHAGNVQRQPVALCPPLRRAIRAQPGQQFLNAGQVVADQGALMTPLLCPAKQVERAATQTLETRQQTKSDQHARTETAFLQLAFFILFCQQRGC